MNISDGAIRVLGEMANDFYERSPREGKHVTIYRGKHKGKEGIVFWHGKDKFAPILRETSLERTLGKAHGLWGYRIGVETPGGEKFFTKATYTLPSCAHRYDKICEACLEK